MADTWSTWLSDVRGSWVVGRWMSGLRHLTWMIGLVVLTSCGKTQPQRPTFKNRPAAVKDSTVVAMVALNQKMAEDADSRLIPYVTEDYALQEDGYWVSGLRDVETGFRDSIQVTARWRVYDTDGQLYEDRHETLTVGRTGEMRVLDPVLRQMHPGDSVSILAPWYMAYGSLGSQVVPPYTNVRIELIIEN